MPKHETIEFDKVYELLKRILDKYNATLPFHKLNISVMNSRFVTETVSKEWIYATYYYDPNTFESRDFEREICCTGQSIRELCKEFDRAVRQSKGLPPEKLKVKLSQQ
jgi:hypothetical protein